MDPRKEDIAKQYGPAEHMTGPLGRFLLEQCGLDRADGSEDIVLLDNATGTGIVLVHLYDLLPPAAQTRLQVVAGDVQPSMLKAVQERAEKNGWTKFVSMQSEYSLLYREDVSASSRQRISLIDDCVPNRSAR